MNKKLKNKIDYMWTILKIYKTEKKIATINSRNIDFLELKGGTIQDEYYIKEDIKRKITRNDKVTYKNNRYVLFELIEHDTMLNRDIEYISHYIGVTINKYYDILKNNSEIDPIEFYKNILEDEVDIFNEFGRPHNRCYCTYKSTNEHYIDIHLKFFKEDKFNQME